MSPVAIDNCAKAKYRQESHPRTIHRQLTSVSDVSSILVDRKAAAAAVFVEVVVAFEVVVVVEVIVVVRVLGLVGVVVVGVVVVEVYRKRVGGGSGSTVMRC